jgi:predicted kinase
MERSLIILRGLPGSGKSSLAGILNIPHCCADDYFMKDGKYDFRIGDLGKAHAWCQNKCKTWMENWVPQIVVANTSTTARELKPYYDLAKKYGYRVYSVIVENRHDGKNEHNVPEESIQKMLERFSIKLI